VWPLAISFWPLAEFHFNSSAANSIKLPDMKTRDLHQTIVFPTDSLDLYKCIMDARIHSSFTGDEAIIEDQEGSSFSVFSGYAHGKNIVLERGKKIIQSWRANEEGWPEDHFSEVVFLFKDVPGGCELIFYHTAVPEANADNIEKGWAEYYWEPLTIYLER
jgi:activator of HSP90 ATPase